MRVLLVEIVFKFSILKVIKSGMFCYPAGAFVVVVLQRHVGLPDTHTERMITERLCYYFINTVS